MEATDADNLKLTMQLQLLPSLHFTSKNGGKSFVGGFKGQTSGMTLTCAADSGPDACDVAKASAGIAEYPVVPRPLPEVGGMTDEAKSDFADM